MSAPAGDLGDTLAGIAVIGTVSEILPPIAALFAIIWTGIRMYEWVRFRILGLSNEEKFK